MYARLKRKRAGLSTNIQQNGKKYASRTNMSGVNLKCLFQSGFVQTYKSGKQGYQFNVQVLDVDNTNVPNGFGTKEPGVLQLETKIRDGAEVQAETVPIKSYDQLSFISTFEVPVGLRPGDIVVMYYFHPEKYVWNGEERMSLKCKTVSKLAVSDTERMNIIDQIPGGSPIFHLQKPSYDDDVKYRADTAILTIAPPRDEALKKPAGAYSYFPQNDEGDPILPEEPGTYSFVKQSDNETNMCFRGDFQHQQWKDGEDQCALIKVALWREHLAQMFGITNVKAWEALGPNMMKHFRGKFVAYPDTERTLRKTMNGSEMKRGDDEPDFIVDMKVSNVLSDVRQTVKHSGYKVSRKWVEDYIFKGDLSVTSPHAVNNPYTTKTRPEIINCHEFNGKIGTFPKEVEYYLLTDGQIDADEHAQLDELDLATREACFMKKKEVKALKVKPPLNIKYNIAQVFAIFPDEQPSAKKQKKVGPKKH
jgi:hypothetical protein